MFMCMYVYVNMKLNLYPAFHIVDHIQQLFALYDFKIQVCHDATVIE